MEFSDMSITIDEYFKILRNAWENSAFFNGWEQEWHPDDLHCNFDTVSRSVGDGLSFYTTLVGEKVRKSRKNSNFQKNYDSDQKTVNDMKLQAAAAKANPERVQVFGGTIPAYTNNRVFGDNV